jgi:hypothetical protein
MRVKILPRLGKPRNAAWRGASSYWKHRVESYLRSRDKSDPYVSNGMFIAAAIAGDFIIERIPNSPNCCLNISSKGAD